MNNENHTQVRLRKPDPTMDHPYDRRWTQYQCYVPSEFAEKGRIIDIKDEYGNWDTGWEVFEVFNTLPTAVVREREQDYKKTRRASDI